MFSTNLGRSAPHAASKSPVIIRSSPEDDQDNMIADLRRKFPAECKSITAPVEDIPTYFDLDDIRVHGWFFLFSVLCKIALQNQMKLQQVQAFVENWRITHITLFQNFEDQTQDIFTDEEREVYGYEFLTDAFVKLREQQNALMSQDTTSESQFSLQVLERQQSHLQIFQPGLSNIVLTGPSSHLYGPTNLQIAHSGLRNPLKTATDDARVLDIQDAANRSIPSPLKIDPSIISAAYKAKSKNQPNENTRPEDGHLSNSEYGSAFNFDAGQWYSSTQNVQAHSDRARSFDASIKVQQTKHYTIEESKSFYYHQGPEHLGQVSHHLSQPPDILPTRPDQSRPKHQNDPGVQEPKVLRPFKVWVGRISPSDDEDSLIRLFEPFGLINRIEIIRSRPKDEKPRQAGYDGYAFVTFARVGDGRTAITSFNSSQQASGSKMIAKPAHHRSSGRSKKAGQCWPKKQKENKCTYDRAQ